MVNNIPTFKSMPTSAYYEAQGVNQSRLKLLLRNNPEEYNQVQEPELYFQEKEHFVIGDAIDCKLTCPEEFDTRFYVSTLLSKPSDTMISIIRYIFDTFKDRYPDKFISSTFVGMASLPEFKAIIIESLDAHEYQKNWKTETRINKVLEHHAYWAELVDSDNKTILSQEDMSTITQVEMSLKSNPLCAHLFQTPRQGIEIFYQFPIFFEYEGHDCKGLLDIVVINHKERTIQIIDVKTLSRDTLYFPYQYKKFRYDIQGAFYYVGILKMFSNLDTLKDYKVEKPQFLVESTIKPGTPLIYTMESSAIAQAIDGEDAILDTYTYITLRPKVIGFRELLQDLTFYQENGFSKKRNIVENNNQFYLDSSYTI